MDNRFITQDFLMDGAISLTEAGGVEKLLYGALEHLSRHQNGINVSVFNVDFPACSREDVTQHRPVATVGGQPNEKNLLGKVTLSRRSAARSSPIRLGPRPYINARQRLGHV